MRRLALFDLDDTLVDQAGAFARWAAAFVDEYRLAADAADWLITAHADLPGPKDRLFAAVRERFGLGPSVETLWAGYRSRMPELVVLRPHVLDGLAALRTAGWRLGIVSNGMADNQIAKIERTGLAAAVDAWCVSGEIGVRKPGPRIFAVAAARCGRDPRDGGWIVGDRPAHDVDGGRRAGLNTCWISHRRPWPADLPPPDHTAPDTYLGIRALASGPGAG
jgi:putative hydrolase of the HAD superfamily